MGLIADYGSEEGLGSEGGVEGFRGLGFRGVGVRVLGVSDEFTSAEPRSSLRGIGRIY